MSVNFDDMASKAKAAHEARIAEQDRQDAAQRDDKGRTVEAAIAALTADVLPLLEKAAAAFRQNGIETKITKDFEVKGIVSKNPTMTFRCI
jgi:NCAIR mutase (PurE)-related protein